MIQGPLLGRRVASVVSAEGEKSISRSAQMVETYLGHTHQHLPQFIVCLLYTSVDEQTGLLYSTHPAKRIDLFAPDGIREGVSPKRTGQLAYKNVPYDLDFYEGRLFVSSNGTEKFCERCV